MELILLRHAHFRQSFHKKSEDRGMYNIPLVEFYFGFVFPIYMQESAASLEVGLATVGCTKII